MNKYRIKDLCDAAKKDLHSRGRYKPYRKYDRRNDIIMGNLFKRTLKGEIDGFYLVSEKTFRAWHKSTKEENAVQHTFGFYRDGEIILNGDTQIKSVEDFLREGYPHGIYAEIS